MATKTIQTCDVCGIDASTTATFSIDGSTTEVDLCAKHAKEFAATNKPYVSAGRTIGRSRSAAKKPAVKKAPAKKDAKKTTEKAATAKRARRGTSTATEVRAWANANGIPVGLKGVVRKEVVEAYRAAQKD